MRIPLLSLNLSCGGELLAELLAFHGISHIFTIPGSQTLPIMHGIKRRHRITLVVPRSETNAVFMAEGFGKAKGFPAVVLSTLGPGVANELPALYSAKLSESPILSISPAQPQWKFTRFGEIFQGLEHEHFLKPALKDTFVVNNLTELASTIKLALKSALEQPMGPVHIDVSFPILFGSVLFHSFPLARKEEEGFASRYLITEDQAEGLTFLNTNFDNLTKLHPGIKGAVLPFGVGVKLAHRNSDVRILTSSDDLFNHLDSLVVALECGITPEIYYTREEERLNVLPKAMNHPVFPVEQLSMRRNSKGFRIILVE